jgi:hypothetical protein
MIQVKSDADCPAPRGAASAWGVGPDPFPGGSGTAPERTRRSPTRHVGTGRAKCGVMPFSRVEGSMREAASCEACPCLAQYTSRTVLWMLNLPVGVMMRGSSITAFSVRVVSSTTTIAER